MLLRGIPLIQGDGRNLACLLQICLLLPQLLLNFGECLARCLCIVTRALLVTLSSADRLCAGTCLMRNTQAIASTADCKQQEQAANDHAGLHTHTALPDQPALT